MNIGTHINIIICNANGTKERYLANMVNLNNSTCISTTIARHTLVKIAVKRCQSNRTGMNSLNVSFM